MAIKPNYSLKNLNTFGLDVLARHYTEISSVDEAIDLIKSEQLKGRELLLLGGGSNLLFTGDFDGIVVKVNIGGIYVVREDEHHFWVKSGAGVIWHDLVESCIKANFGGLENLSLIPGTVGAAPIQNIGAYGVELKDCFEALEAVDLSSGEKRYFTNQECQFGYRDSIFKNELKGRYLITNVVLRLRKEPMLYLDYGNIRTELASTGKKEITIRDVSNAVIKIRQSKLPDPNKVGNAGSFFKNPIVGVAIFEAIKKSYPDMPFFELNDTRIKIPAAWLIDQCQLKGLQHKGAAVHTNQPLVLINKYNATGKDIVELADIIGEKVREKFGIRLEAEVSII